MQNARIGRIETDSDSNAPGSGGVGRDDSDDHEEDLDSTAAPDIGLVKDKVHSSRATDGAPLNSDAASTIVVEIDQDQKASTKQLSNDENSRELEWDGGTCNDESRKDPINSGVPASGSSVGQSALSQQQKVAAAWSKAQSALLAVQQQYPDEPYPLRKPPRRTTPAKVSISGDKIENHELGGAIDCSPSLNGLDLFGTSVPKSEFFTPSSARSGGQSFATPMSFNSPASLSLLQSFATAHSSLASYASAASGPRRIWMPARVHEKRVANLLDEHDEDSDYTGLNATAETDQAAFESLTNAISARILEDRYTFRDDGSCYRLPVTPTDRLRFKDEGSRAAIIECLCHLHSIQPSGEVTITYSLLKVINMIVSEARAFLRKQNGVLWDSAYDIQNLQRDVALQIYEYASSKPHLRGHVSANQFLGSQPFTSEWLIYLKTRGLILDDLQALDWSGRGQHVEYAADEGSIIPLMNSRMLGYSASAIVQSVRCRRIQLARKLIRCNKRLTREIAITEVEHLQRLHHRHIVRLVGTYVIKRELAILMYPVAQWNLEEYLDEAAEGQGRDRDPAPLWKFLGCLCTALKYIHDSNIKHMDIKPGNLLIRKTSEIQIYIADFGIARAYKSADEACTDSATLFTPIYAAPEVATQDKRGFPADIFSLGCVFMEIISVLAQTSTPSINERAKLASILEPPNNVSYHANINSVIQWYRRVTNEHKELPGRRAQLLRPNVDVLAVFESMLRADPDRRPTAGRLAWLTKHWCCGHCNDGPEPFEAAVDD